MAQYLNFRVLMGPESPIELRPTSCLSLPSNEQRISLQQVRIYNLSALQVFWSAAHMQVQSLCPTMNTTRIIESLYEVFRSYASIFPCTYPRFTYYFTNYLLSVLTSQIQVLTRSSSRLPHAVYTNKKRTISYNFIYGGFLK